MGKFDGDFLHQVDFHDWNFWNFKPHGFSHVT